MLKVLQEEFINNTKNFIRVYKYEDLCIDSVSKFRSIFNEFGLRYDEKVRGLHHYLTKNQSQHGDFDYKKTMIRHYVKRNSEIYPDVWKNRLSEKEIQIIYEICDAFDST